MRRRKIAYPVAAAIAFAAATVFLFAGESQATGFCARMVTADVVALDQPIMFNRLGAQNVNGMIYALRRDVVREADMVPLSLIPDAQLPGLAGLVVLRGDNRPRPIALRVAAGDCLRVRFTNLLSAAANPRELLPVPNPLDVDEQTADRFAGFHPQGMQLAIGIDDDSSMVGKNPGASGSLAAPGGSRTYTFFAEKEGTYLVSSYGAQFGSEGIQGNSANGLFGAVNVEPSAANPAVEGYTRFYRSQVTEEEMRLATKKDGGGALIKTGQGHPVLNYEAKYPTGDVNANGVIDGGEVATVWDLEGKGGLPVLNMLQWTGGNTYRLVHTDLNAIIAGPGADGSFTASTYPLESHGKRNPTVPHRLEPFREFTVIFHDEVAAAQVFPGFYKTDPVFRYVLEGVKDGFMINYGSAGIGSEIISNRLSVGPMHDCLDCSFEEFFLSSYTVADPAMVVDVPANVGLENLLPGEDPPPGATGPKATKAFFPADPSNVHHSYMSDATKFRNLHVGKEQHIFHLHNHQWLYSANDDNSNYLDAQGIGPGSGYTYEINFGGSGNRNKSAGDAIFHCHFYPHFAQGMWELWRHHDVFEWGTRLAVSGPAAGDGAFHTVKFALQDGTPALVGPGERARALPDGEIVAGTPIPGLVPLPGKPMAPMPQQKVTVVANPSTTTASAFHGATPGGVVPVGSLAKVDRTPSMAPDLTMVHGRPLNPTGLGNPGYPFWIAGIEKTVGQRAPTPPLDMYALEGYEGFDGGLPRHSLHGIAAAHHTAGDPAFRSTVHRLDFSKEMLRAKPEYFPEEGTDIERAVMEWHAKMKYHPTFLPSGAEVNPAHPLPSGVTGFRTNGGGAPGHPGSPYHEPCVDDAGNRLVAGKVGEFFDGNLVLPNQPESRTVTGSSRYNADDPRVYKGANIQFDAVLNKVGYHYPQERIIALWDDAVPTIDKIRPPEPFVMRMNTFDCVQYYHTNLVPKEYELDDFQVRTPTDIIGQHIHLPKWDLTTADGAANGWNYEDGTLSPGAVLERIEAINSFNAEFPGEAVPTLASNGRPAGETHLEARAHPFFGNDERGRCPGGPWCGARTTMQRWFADPVVNTAKVDRGLGIIFTHDHYGPSTHQQIGLYGTVLVEPAGSTWVHNETGKPLGENASLTEYVSPELEAAIVAMGGGRSDGGPTSWQAAILPPSPGEMAARGVNVKAEDSEPYREFYLAFSDFQHAYEAGAFVGVGPDGVPLETVHVGTPAQGGGILYDAAANTFSAIAPAETFRRAINPPARAQIAPVFPDLYAEVAGGILPGCPARPCPGAISVQDPGMLVVNYRNEPVGLRVFDPGKQGPDGVFGTQADGMAGDLAFALKSTVPRKIDALNRQPAGVQSVGVFPTDIIPVEFPAVSLNRPSALETGDPFTPLMRTYSGDRVRIKVQAGGHEEEHNAMVHGMKWLQGGSGLGAAPNSGWRNSQAVGIAEQFTFNSPVNADMNQFSPTADYLYSADAGNDGWWSGLWGLLRDYRAKQDDLFELRDVRFLQYVENRSEYKYGVCPRTAKDRIYDITAVLANEVLPNPGVSIIPAGDAATMHEGGPLDPGGGTLVYNPRNTAIPVVNVADPGFPPINIGGGRGPLHDPTGMLYVRTDDLEPVNPASYWCSRGGVKNPRCTPVRLKAGVRPEPVTLRAAAGECIRTILRNRLPEAPPDLASYTSIIGVVKRQQTVVGSTTFNYNLVRPSSSVGLHPQLVEYDITKGDGTNVGINNATNSPLRDETVLPGRSIFYTWYAGDLQTKKTGETTVNGETVDVVRIEATPVEFGGSNLSPADKLKQGQKGLVGALVVEPQGSTWVEDPDRRAAATVTAPGQPSFRDFSVVIEKGLALRYADGSPVEHINGEAVGIPEDSQDSSHMAVNYGTEPMWFRFGKAPNGPFGHAGGGGFGDVGNAHEAYSNVLTGGQDPATPVFTAYAGKPFRLRVGMPFGTTRGTTFNLHGHVWQRAPYICPGENRDGIPGNCLLDTVASRAIGDNKVSFYQGGQESITPYAHFDLVLPKAGGRNAVPGDYLFRDQGSFGTTAGIWGIMRVQ